MQNRELNGQKDKSANPDLPESLASGKQSEPVYRWDHHSDQPHIIRNRKAKRQLYLRGAIGSLKTLLVAFIVVPTAWLKLRLAKAKSLPAHTSAIGLCVNVESELAEKTTIDNNQLSRCVEELGIRHLLVRVPLDQSDNLQVYESLCQSLQAENLLIDVLQDRESIENSELLEYRLRKVFACFSPYARQFKVGNAVNRRKWAFVSLDEYFRFFRTAQQLRNREFPDLQLFGGGIIDFELPNFARSLIHFAQVHFDGVAALLYVDRRGAPENTQLGSNLVGKIAWFDAIMRISNKTDKKLYITETNWPIIGTEPFAPAVGDCMVDEDKQAAYLARYYLLAFASGKVEAVYWHQLVAPGYGLIDNRGEQVRKRRAYYALKTINSLLDKATINSFEKIDSLYMLTATQRNRRITAIWTNDNQQIVQVDALQVLSASSLPDSIEIIQLTGESLTTVNASIEVSGEPTYFVQKTA